MKSFFEEEKIEYAGAVDFENCRVKKEYLVNRVFSDRKPRSALMVLAPYYVQTHTTRNVSRYCIANDYHEYMIGLLNRLCNLLAQRYGNYKFYPFCDHSPIDEVHAAAVAGLGVIGDNSLLINEKYGSYVFIGEIITDMPYCEFPDEYRNSGEILQCLHCSLCQDACPAKGKCLSSITQKKGELDDGEARLIKENKTAWGCDICQEVCPMNKRQETPIEYFKTENNSHITLSDIENMSDEEFRKKAYSWRGKDTLIRNLKLLEK